MVRFNNTMNKEELHSAISEIMSMYESGVLSEDDFAESVYAVNLLLEDSPA